MDALVAEALAKAEVQKHQLSDPQAFGLVLEVVRHKMRTPYLPALRARFYELRDELTASSMAVAA